MLVCVSAVCYFEVTEKPDVISWNPSCSMFEKSQPACQRKQCPLLQLVASHLGISVMKNHEWYFSLNFIPDNA
jgi:hypothetical protein